MNVVCAIGGSWGVRAAVKAMNECRASWELVYSVGGLNAAIRLQPQMVFFLNWSRKVPASVLEQTTAVNFHCTDLRCAFGRGGNPIENLLLRGYTDTVISAHVMVEELDAGPVYGVSEPIQIGRYIARPDTWFDAGTVAHRICEITPASGLFSGIRGGAEDEEGCAYSEFDVVPAGSKEDIRQRFIEPTARLMAQIVRGELTPKPQEGEPVVFKRLSEPALRAFWASREKAA